MSVASIQSFLTSKGGFLKDFSENGRSAAQIIYDAAHGYGDGTGTINGIALNSSTGTVSPQIILVTLQKEQGLLTMPTRNDSSLNAAMGYGCPDGSSCNPSYTGFTKQVENGAWQLRYNYEAAFKDDSWRTTYYGSQTFASKPGSVGQTVGLDSYTVTFANAATASLYRYTPHVYNGNYNFYNLFNSYFVTYSHSFVRQNAYPTVGPGQSYNFVLVLKNTGSATWQQDQVNLGTDRSRDRIPAYTREGDGPSGWIKGNRIRFQEASVAPNENATFSFWMRNDGMSIGTYREYFRLVADGIQWMEDYGIYWDVSAVSTADTYRHSFINGSAYPTLSSGESYNLVVRVRNTGTATWQQDQVNLGTDRSRDRIPVFTREGNGPSGWIKGNRIRFQEASVAPGGTATYSFWIKNDGVSPGVYHEYFRLVADGITWMEDYGIYWDVTAI
jgi:archaellum component FlaG (FlaF/FlaG flagellin family)